MKIFLSWSGERSKKIAEYLNTWIPCIIQSAEPWISSTNIDRGTIWFKEINDTLANVKIGIICLTRENKSNPWILFEAGSLAKGLNSQHVCTLLIDEQPQDIENPLAQFNHTLPQKESMFELLKTINKQADTPLKEHILEQTFEKYWPDFESEFEKILASTPAKKEKNKRSQDDILAEILMTVRGIDRRMSNDGDGLINIEDNPSNPNNPGGAYFMPLGKYLSQKRKYKKEPATGFYEDSLTDVNMTAEIEDLLANLKRLRSKASKK